jgi:dienelactone hydrolase
MTTSLRTVTCHHGSAVLEGQLAVPRLPGPHPAVMVMHTAHGLGDQVRDVVRLLAELGYVALATDMYGGGVFHADVKAAGASLAPLWNEPQLLRSRVVAWFETLSARPDVDRKRVAAIGYCFGGQCVLELARSGADVKAVVSYHGILKTAFPAEAGTIRAHVAVYTGAKDPYAPAEQVEAFRQEMTAAGARWQIMTFGEALHAFTDPASTLSAVPGLAYDEIAHSVSWAGTLALLEQALAPHGA